MKKLLLILPLLFLTACNYEGAAPADEPSAISNFEECINAGNPIMESYPRQCRANGQLFIEEVNLPTDELPINDNTTETPAEGAIIEYLPKDSDKEESRYKPSEMEVSCSDEGGIWMINSNECENIGKEWCDENGGTWNECASACRNDPEAEICTMQCVIICKF